ncbi:F-box/LRR-repeat protein At4g29420 [Neltuma alba]|uniref:F-box/LRR-repeat protein At4g29420 n=1 Tax=Neltuma alba TaxID=207710 RepID=UPI0010A536CC|nr:F-box/LRR-repeat protein At4g29420 [Prosopis alba]
MSMDNLPPCLVLEILSRLSDSTDLARCRVVSKTFNALSHDVRSINLVCSLSRYLSSRSLVPNLFVTPFKTVFRDLVRASGRVDSVSLGVDKSLAGITFDDVDDDSDDLYLTDTAFVKTWLPRIAPDLKSLSISDFWVQSCWRRSDVLSLISWSCHGLVKLLVRNAWLSVDGLVPMPMLTSLTLEFVRLDDEDLCKINKCFPNLLELNLIGVGGLREPKISLLHLRTCQWSVSNAPLSLAICAPKLANLQLKCIRPRLIVLEASSLSAFDLSIEGTDEFKWINCHSIEYFKFGSSNLACLSGLFRSCKTVKRLKVDSVRRSEHNRLTTFGFETLFESFPLLSSLDLGPGAWHDMETSFCMEGLKHRIEMNTLKELVAHMVVQEIESTLAFIFSVLDNCTKLSNISLVIHHDVDPPVASNLMSRCRNYCPRVRWKLGIWKDGIKDTWVSDAN